MSINAKTLPNEPEAYVFKGRTEFMEEFIRISSVQREILKINNALNSMTSADAGSDYFYNMAEKKINLEKDVNIFFLRCISTLNIQYNKKKVKEIFSSASVKGEVDAIKFAGFFCGTFFGLFLAFLYFL